MAIYAGAHLTTAATAVAAWEIRTAATDRAYAMELGVTLVAATASQYGLARPTAIGVTPTAPVTFLAEDTGAPASTVVHAVAWGTAPVAPAVTAFLRKICFPATIGAGVVWTFPRGLIVPISSSIALFGITTVSVAQVWAVIDD